MFCSTTHHLEKNFLEQMTVGESASWSRKAVTLNSLALNKNTRNQ